jgi:hypothetical protein
VEAAPPGGQAIPPSPHEFILRKRHKWRLVAATLRTRLDALQAELRALADGNPAVLPALDRLGISPEQGTQPGS